MIDCKKHIIATCFSLMLPILSWAEAPVVDDSDNFAIVDEQQMDSPSAARSKYDEPQSDNAEFDGPRADRFQMDSAQNDDEAALAKEEQGPNPSQNTMNGNAQMIDKIQTMQREIQELRGQLEVQAHDLKVLQQQQLSFYKDLDTRLSSSAAKPATGTAPTDISMGAASRPAPAAKVATPVATKPAAVVLPASKNNPADEQISYLAAYELVKNKRYDDAINAMRTFVQKYPQGGYTANAQYWLGELYMVKKDYPSAIDHFELVLQQFPSSSKAAASMLKVGYAYAASGNNQEAKQRLQQVVKTYPGTPTAQLANLKLESINAL